VVTGGIEIHVYYVAKALSKRFSVSMLAERKGNFRNKICSFDKVARAM